MDTNRKKLTTAIAVALIILGLVIGLFYGVEMILNVFDNEDTRPPINREVVVIDNVEYLPKEGVNFLLIGVDQYGGFADDEDLSYYNTQCADFIAILSVDTKAETCTVFQINRDTMVEYDLLGVGGYKYGTMHGQICLSHTQGNGGSTSAQNTINAVKNYFSTMTSVGTINIDYYVAFTMDVVPIFAGEVMDIVSGEKDHGVTVTLDEGQSLDGLNLQNSTLDGNLLTLRGTDALNFIRGRYYIDDSTNIARMKRQRQFMNAFVAEMSRNGRGLTHTQMLNCYDLLSQDNHLISNATPQRFYELINFVAGGDIVEEGLKYQFNGIVFPQGTSVKGEKYMEFTPDADDLKRLMIEVFLQKK